MSAMSRIKQQQQDRWRERDEQKQRDMEADPECYNILGRIHELVDSEMDPNISYFNTLSSFRNNLEQLRGTENEHLIGEMSDKLTIITECLAKEINKKLTSYISHGGAKSRNVRNKNKNKITKRNQKNKK
jgi:hypothetical protein